MCQDSLILSKLDLLQSSFVIDTKLFHFLVSLRLRSVKNIQKITKSMKMVSAAKFGKAERELRPARVYGAGASGLLITCQI